MSKILRYFNLAAEAAISKSDARNYMLGAISIRSDGVIVKSLNSPTETPRPSAHAEAKLSKKLDYGATVYVARVRHLDGNFGMARPCFSCQKFLEAKRVSRVYYTINSVHYGVWLIEKDFDRIYTF